jgi:hypothetical protein
MSASDAITQLESLLGRRLPEDFRLWLTDATPSLPVPSDVVIPDDPPWIDEVTHLYDAERILSATTGERELNRQGLRDVPSGTIVIGDNDNGDYCLLSLRGPDFGSVYYLFHETASPEDDDWAGIFVLAPDFKEWLDTLAAKPPDPSKPDWERICREERARILNTASAPRRPWWRFW